MKAISAPRLNAIYSILFSVYLGSCGGSGPSSLEDVFGLEGDALCQSLNRSVEYAVGYHLSVSESEIPQLYNKAIIATLVVSVPWLDTKTANEIKKTIFNNGEGTDHIRLGSCADLATIAKVRNESPVFTAQSENSTSPSAAHLSELSNPIAQLIAQSAQSRFSSSDSIFQIFLFNFITGMDYYSRYYPSGNVQKSYSYGIKLNIDAQLEYDRRLSDSVMIEAVSPNITSIAPGDRISAIFLNDRWVPVKEMKAEDLEEQIVGSEQSFLKMKVYANQPDQTRVEREVLIEGMLESNSSGARPLVSGEIVGNAILIRLYAFEEGLSNQLLAELMRLKDEWSKIESTPSREKPAIILDLRFNGGGSLDEALAVIGLFLPYQRIGQIERKSTTEDLYPTLSPIRFDNPLFLLVNHASASASELTAQVFQETGRALVLGETTFGKGVGQETRSLGVGSTLDGTVSLTAFRFFGPTGKSVQIDGLKPDLLIENSLWNSWKEEIRRKCDLNPSDFEGYCIQRMADLQKLEKDRSVVIPRKTSSRFGVVARNEFASRLSALNAQADKEFKSIKPQWRINESKLMSNEDQMGFKAIDIANLLVKELRESKTQTEAKGPSASTSSR